MLEIRLPSTLRQGAEKLILSSAPRDLAELRKQLIARLPQLANQDDSYIFAINGTIVLHAESKTPIHDGDEVELLMALSGG
jgi:molybdopterin converting factor small subunit